MVALCKSLSVTSHLASGTARPFDTSSTARQVTLAALLDL